MRSHAAAGKSRSRQNANAKGDAKKETPAMIHPSLAAADLRRPDDVYVKLDPYRHGKSSRVALGQRDALWCIGVAARYCRFGSARKL